MFSRQAFRPARTLQKQIRGYASDAPKNGGSNALLFVGLAGLAGAGGYYYMKSSGTPPVPSVTAAPTPAFKGKEQGFISLKLDSIEDVNHNTKKFRFALPDENNVSGLSVASAILTKYQDSDQEKPVIRPYTPVSDEDDKGYMDLLIKRYPDGKMSDYVHKMTPGQTLDIQGPIPKYAWAPNKHEHVAMIAGGTGITPMYQVARQIFKNPEDKTKVTLIFANISEQDILLKKEFDELENTYPRRFRAFYVLDKPSDKWQGGKGYITKDLLKTVLPEPKEENIKVFVCGPPPMYKAISGTKKSPADQGELAGYLKELGYSKEQVYKF